MTGWNTTGETIAGNSTGASGKTPNHLNRPLSIALGPTNTLYISDYSNNRIQKWILGETNGTTIAGQANGTGGATLTEIGGSIGVTADSNDNIYFSDFTNQRVMYRANGASVISLAIGNTSYRGNGTNELNDPCGVYYDRSTNLLYVADAANHRIMRYTPGSSVGTLIAGGNGQGIANTQLHTPHSAFYEASTNSIIIANSGAHNVVRWVIGASSWTLIGGSLTGINGSSSMLLNYPYSAIPDSFGNVYVSDRENHRIQLFPLNELNATTIAGITRNSSSAADRLNRPYWVTIDSQVNLYVADSFNNRVQKFSKL